MHILPFRNKPRNFLEMIPVRNISQVVTEDNRITLLIPKFKKAWMRKWLIPPRRSEYFRIHLDRNGSLVWNLINGERDTGEICRLFEESLPVETRSNQTAYEQVTAFLRQLYRNRFIRFA